MGYMLTSIKIRNLPVTGRRYKVADQDGLFLVVSENGSKHWRFRYAIGERDKSLSLGKFPEISLAQARDERNRLRKLVREHVDPGLERKMAKQMAEFRYSNDFAFIAEKWFQSQKSGWTPRHAKKLWRMLEIHILPYLGAHPVSEIKPLALLTVLKKIEGKEAVKKSGPSMCLGLL